MEDIVGKLSEEHNLQKFLRTGEKATLLKRDARYPSAQTSSDWKQFVCSR